MSDFTAYLRKGRLHHIDFIHAPPQLIRAGKQRPSYGTTIMEQDYVSPPRAIRHPVYLIGRNCRGRWVVREQSGGSGGIFLDRSDALKFAMFECGRAPQSVVMVPGVLELDLNDSDRPKA